LKGDSETVSIKSCGNVLENNIQEKTESNFTIRHDGVNSIRNIMSIDSGSITVSGDSNAVTDNYHQNSDNSDSLPLVVRKGGIESMHFLVKFAIEDDDKKDHHNDHNRKKHHDDLNSKKKH
jgi:hypothetical protein